MNEKSFTGLHDTITLNSVVRGPGMISDMWWKRTVAWGPAVVWAALIFWLSSMSNIPADSFPMFPLFLWVCRKVGIAPGFILEIGGHFFEYFVLGILMSRAYVLHGADTFIEGKPHRFGITSFFTGFFYALSDEFHQSFVPGRHPSWGDVGVDCVGLLVGILIYRRVCS